MSERVFITGASSGLGAAMAREYARRGATIGLASRRKPEMEVLADEIHQAGGTSFIYVLDVSDYSACREAAESFLESTGGIDTVIANAGVSGTDGITSGDLHKIKTILDTNISGVVHTLFSFLPTLRKQKSGRVVFISSVAGYRALPGRSGYSASKAAIRFLADGWRPVLARDSISLTTICPGFIKTPMTEDHSFPMPFLMDAETAAKKMIAAIDARKRIYIFPWQWRSVIPLMKSIPASWIDWLFSLGNR
ncbi:MAG: SDR family NAD(P)-dependent oxidoreductase [FCB group bacterium]|nr:SDR family NAD(P)-dependent oxidoreductase [FCB group bacterium]